jgi:ATP-dependent helicase/nuclease subunit B
LNEKNAGALSVETTFFYIAPRWKDGPLLTRSFLSEDLSGKIGDEIKDTLSRLIGGIQAGHFFMLRGQHCQYCEVAEICRKNHPPSLWRAENDPVAQAHRCLHEKDLKEL